MYSKEHKARAIEIFQTQYITINEAAVLANVHPTPLCHWLKEAGIKPRILAHTKTVKKAKNAKAETDDNDSSNTKKQRTKRDPESSPG